MLSLSTAQLDAWLATFMYPLARISGLILYAPMFSHQAIPNRVKVLLTLGLTIAIAPAVGTMPDISPASGEGLAILATQTLIGLTLAFVLRFAFAALDLAGELTGLQMGLGFATFFDPTNSTNTPVVAQFYGLFAMLFFLAFNGHLLVLALLVQSFSTMPVNVFDLASFDTLAIVHRGQQLFVMGMLLALPIVASLLTANIALGILTRAAPQLNLFAIGFPATLFGGIVLMLIIVPRILPQFENVFMDSIEFALAWTSDRKP